MRLTLLVLALIWMPLATTESQEADIVGTWELVRFENFDNGVPSQPFGAEPKGYFIYTADGHLSIHIMNETPPAEWKSLQLPEDGSGVAGPWYVGYFGRYTVDKAAGTVTHHVEGGTILSYIGTDQERPFTLEGDRLVVGVPGEWERELHRIR